MSSTTVSPTLLEIRNLSKRCRHRVRAAHRARPGVRLKNYVITAK